MKLAKSVLKTQIDASPDDALNFGLGDLVVLTSHGNRATRLRFPVWQPNLRHRNGTTGVSGCGLAVRVLHLLPGNPTLPSRNSSNTQKLLVVGHAAIGKGDKVAFERQQQKGFSNIYVFTVRSS